MEIKPIVKDDYLVFDQDTSLAQLFGSLKQFEKRSALIFKNKKYVGLVQKKKLLRSGLDLSKVEVEHFLHQTPILNQDTDVLSAASLLFDSNCDFLPVENNKKICGVVSSLDIAQLSLGLPEVLKLKITDVKLVKSVHVNKNDPLAKALEIMHDQFLDHLPVLEQGTIKGVISDKDVFRKFLNWSPKRNVSTKFNKEHSTRSAQVDTSPFSSLPVESFATTENLISTNKKALLKEAIGNMVKNNISTVLVMDGKDFIGLLTLRNILKTISELKNKEGFPIRYMGINEIYFTEHEKAEIDRIVQQETTKLSRKLKNPFGLTIQFKETNKGGKKRLLSIHLRVELTGRVLTSEHEGWDVEKPLHQCFEAITMNVKNK
jgi:predicted transcriptional regulator